MNEISLSENAPIAEMGNAQHVHEYVMPIFTERRVDAHLILTGLACECLEEIDLDF
jgi:hypothetical protein